MRLPPFQNLLDAHARDVHRFLIATVGPVEADDVYQETWLAALRAYPGLTEASNLKGWLFTIAHRKAIDHVRARARRATPVSEPADLPEAPVTDGVAVVADEGLWAAVARSPTSNAPRSLCATSPTRRTRRSRPRWRLPNPPHGATSTRDSSASERNAPDERDQRQSRHR